MKKTTKKPVRTRTNKPAVAKNKQNHLSDRNLGAFSKGGAVTTVYVGNLRYTKTENELKGLFSKFGPVSFVKLVKDKKTHKSTGIAFIQMGNRRSAEEAIAKYDGKVLDGRTLKVSIAIESEVSR